MKILFKNERSFGNIVIVTLFVIFLKYIWVKKYVKMRVILFKN